MKTITAIVGLVLFSFAAHAQDLDRPQLRLKPSNKKLDLSYMQKDSPTGMLNQLEKPGNRYSLFPKSSTKKPDTAETAPLAAQMPILVPDSTIQFPILAVKPDSTVAFPMPIIKP